MAEREIEHYNGGIVTVSRRSSRVIVNRANRSDARSQEVLDMKPQHALRLAASLIDHADQAVSDS